MVSSLLKVISKNEYQLMSRLLRKKRKEKGITQEVLASKLGVKQSDISKIERLERRIDLIETIAICHALEVDPAAFVKELELANAPGNIK